MLSLQNIILFSFHSLIFYLEIHKHPGASNEREWGNSSLKRTYVEGGGEGVYIYKMNRDEQGGGADQKLEV